MSKLAKQSDSQMSSVLPGASSGAGVAQWKWVAFGLVTALGGAAVTLGVVRHQEHQAASATGQAVAAPPTAPGPEQRLPPPPMGPGDKPAPAVSAATAGEVPGELPPLPPPPVVGGGLPIEEPPYQAIAEEPPPPPEEEMPPSPFDGAVWVGGHWEWDDGWSWVDGRWLAPPQPGYVYNPPYYEDRGGVVLFIGGYWRRPGAVFVPPSPGAAIGVPVRAAIGKVQPVSRPTGGFAQVGQAGQAPAPAAPPAPRQQAASQQKTNAERPHQEAPQRVEPEERQRIEPPVQEQRPEPRAELLWKQQQAEAEARQRAEEVREAAEALHHHQAAAPRGRR